MGLKSFFSRRQAPDTPPPAPRSRPRATQGDADAVQQARVRARQRLTGAAVLLGIGIIGFPLLFETQPRPIPVDIPITIPNKDTAAPLAVPAEGRASAPAARTQAASNAMIDETAADAGHEVSTPTTSTPGGNGGSAPTTLASTDKAEPATPPKPSDKAAEKPGASAGASQPASAKPTPLAEEDVPAKPAPPPHKTSAVAATGEDAARAKALLDGKPASEAAAAGRFVVQVGAFADAGSAHQTRLKVEKLGLKTYTQAVDTSNGKRIRVRVGPFASRDEAAAAAAKLHAAGLPSAVLTL